LVKDDYNMDKVWWGGINTPLDSKNFEILDPMNTWLQKVSYVNEAIQLAHWFHLNFDKFIDRASDEIIHGAPRIDAHLIMDHNI
jgi:ATP-dependent phosphoenolpyruvate carboxykinase